MKRTRIMIVGESGSGLLSVGEIVAKGLKASGYFITADREFPSLIKGGQSCFSINYDDEPIWSLSRGCDILVALDKKSLKKYLPRLRDGGVLAHGYGRLWGIKAELADCETRGITVLYQDARATAEEFGGNALMANMVMVGMLWRALGLDYASVAAEVSERFASKPKILKIDLDVLDAAYTRSERMFVPPAPSGADNGIYADGAHMLALGAVHAGLRMYVGYPMSPSTGVLKHVANVATEYSIAFKQAEDEITAANMVLGGMYAGTRAMTATSGGGFDLMTETVSLSGITETPWLCVLAQRPGPGTGLPTWTTQGDLQLAVRGGHGEFARIVVSVSDPSDNFELIQHAFNWAEEFQVPVIVLTDKCVQEQKTTIAMPAQNTIEIKRGLATDTADLVSSDRYAITDSGLSTRWVPTRGPICYANGDEHNPDGTLTEDEQPCREMIMKRVRKLEHIKEHMPQPHTIGSAAGAAMSFIGWGHTRCAMRDAIKDLAEQGVAVNYLHFDVLWPLQTDALEQFLQDNSNVHLIETNATGQLGQLLAEAGFALKPRLLKWSGRPFFVEDIIEYVRKNLS